MTGLVSGLRPMITRVACRVTVEAEGSTGAGLAAWHSCSAGRLLATPDMGVALMFFSDLSNHLRIRHFLAPKVLPFLV